MQVRIAKRRLVSLDRAQDHRHDEATKADVTQVKLGEPGHVRDNESTMRVVAERIVLQQKNQADCTAPTGGSTVPTLLRMIRMTMMV